MAKGRKPFESGNADSNQEDGFACVLALTQSSLQPWSDATVAGPDKPAKHVLS